MKFILSLLAILLFSTSIYAQSETEKDNFAKDLFDHFKKGQLNKIEKLFVDDELLEKFLVAIEKKEPAFLKKIPKDSIRRQQAVARKQFAQSLKQVYNRCTTASPTLAMAEIKEIEFRFKREQPFPSYRLNIRFEANGKEGWLRIRYLAFDKQRNKLFIVSNKMSGEVISEMKESVRIYEPSERVTENGYKEPEEVLVPDQSYDVEESTVQINKNKIFSFVEVMPEFPGGEVAMQKFISKNINYPPLAMQNGIQGKVYARFIVGKDGAIRDVKIIRDIGGGCGEEVKRLIQSMPNWKNGSQRGVAVPVRFTLPVRFNLK